MAVCIPMRVVLYYDSTKSTLFGLDSQYLFCGNGDGPVIVSLLKRKVGGLYKAFVITKEVCSFCFGRLILERLTGTQGFDELTIPIEKIDRVPEKALERRAQVYFEKEFKCTLVKADKSLSSSILKLEEEDPQVILLHNLLQSFTFLSDMYFLENAVRDFWCCICETGTNGRK